MSSYVLDKDLISACLSARKTEETPRVCTSTNYIDVNCNSNLLGASLYQRSSDNETKKQMADLQDQLKMLRTDLDKKDQLICNLSSMKEVEKIRNVECSKYDTMFNAERQIAEAAKKDLACFQSKHEAMSLELSEYKVKVQARDDRIGEMKREIETMKSENGTMSSMICALKTRIREVEDDLGGFENVATKSSITISALQKDNKDMQQNVLNLESRIRTHISEREDAERKTELMNAKLSELATQVSTITGTHVDSSIEGLSVLITKISSIVDECTMVKGKLMTTTDSLSSNESENKANRETITRLVGEINKFEKAVADHTVVVDNLKAERDCALNNKTIVEAEIVTLKDRINNIQTAWQSTKTELESKESNFTAQVSNVKTLEYDALYHKNCHEALREQIAALLSDGFVKVEACGEQIKEKIKLLMTSSKDRGLMIANMEEKINQLASQLADQIKIYKEMECKYSHNEQHVVDLEHRLKSLDNEYCANEVMRDNLRSDRVKYLSFLERMGKVLKVSEISADVGLDMNVDLILSRAEQLVKLEADAIADKQTNIYNLQRKIKQLKEQLDNKDLHLDLLRKKLSGMESEKQGKCALEREVDDHVMMSKKFKLKVEKLSEQLGNLKAENNDLKAQLLDMNGLKLRTCDQDKEIAVLLCKIKDLECVKEKLSIKLVKLRDEKDNQTSEMCQTRTSSDSAVNALSHELRSLKQDLEKTTGREKQLLDFRCVVARMLGLDVNTLAVADYEIIARIERVVNAFNATGILPVTVQRVQTPTPPTNPNFNYEFISSQYDSTNMGSMSIEPIRPASPCKPRSHHHHHHTQVARELSASPHHIQQHNSHHSHQNGHHNVHHNGHHNGHHGSHVTHVKEVTRHRSKSPKKCVTIIDPNSY